MKRFALIVTLMFFASMACANDTGYVSPESYAINEADMTDYFDVPAPRKLNIDELDNGIKANKVVEGSLDSNVKREKSAKIKRSKGEKKPYEERAVYKAAKWWTDKTYKLEDPHHGEKHEIKIKAREEYERQQAEKALEEQK